MRLGQLARKLDIKPTQIVSFLTKSHNINVEENLNTKIEDDILKLVLDKFKIEKPVVAPKKIVKAITPELIDEVDVEKAIDTPITIEAEEKTEDPIIESEVIEEVVNEIIEEEIVEEAIDLIVEDELKTENPETKDVLADEKLIAYDEDGEPIELTVIDGVIKAPKKELEGFKVIGKIELPTKAKAISFIHTTNDVNDSNTTDITETIDTTRKELVVKRREQYLARVEKRKLNTKHKRSKSRRTLSEMDIREKENKLAVEKQIQQQKVRKEKQKKHYQQVVKTTSNQPKKKKVKSNNSNDLPKIKTYDKEPTTKLGRIWKWFNT